MAVDGGGRRADAAARRYPVLGTATAWYAVLLALLGAAGAAAFGAVDAAIAAAALGWAAYALCRSLVVEVSPAGLTRGLLATGAFRARTTLLPWDDVVDVHTAWCRPGDDSALETLVRGRSGRTIRLSTGMGLAAYWSCLRAVVRHAPGAARSGLTDAVLGDGPPARHHLVSAGGTAAALALVLVALVAMHYVWAQGRSSLARQLEAGGPAGGPADCGAGRAADTAPGGEGRACR